MNRWIFKRWWVVGGVILLSLLAFLFSLSPFRLKEVVVVTPSTHLSEVELVRLTGVKRGDSLPLLSLRRVRENLLQFPWIEEVALAKAYPGRLIVSVQEQEPVALIKLDGLYLVNRHGLLFKKVTANDPRNLPVITGLSPPAKHRLLPLLALITRFQGEASLQKLGLSEIHWEEKGVSLFTLKPVIRVLLGKDQWDRRLEKLVQILPEVGEGKAPLSIDLTYEKRIFVKRKLS